MAKPPIKTTFLAFARFGILGGSGGRDDHIAAEESVVGPVRRKGDLLFIGDLEAFEHPQNLVEVASQFRRVVGMARMVASGSTKKTARTVLEPALG